jgi:hypothetical protein
LVTSTALWWRPAARQQKITFGDMRETGVCGVLIYCANYHCSHSIAVIADRWLTT